MPSISSTLFALGAAALSYATLSSAQTPAPQKRPDLFKPLGVLPFKRPAYLGVVPAEPGSNVKNLYISSFGAVVPEEAFYIKNFTGMLADATTGKSLVTPTRIEKADSGMVWPNEIRRAPANVFGREGVVVSSGWFIPIKNRYGGIWYAPVRPDGTVEEWHKIVSVKGFFYHRVKFMDVDGDGQMEIISCRARNPVYGPKRGVLVYLKPVNAETPYAEPWKETVLGNHCDTYFEVEDIDEDGRQEIISPEFFGRALTLISSTSEQGFFNDSREIQYTTIDNTYGSFFEAQLVDLNNDGKLDLIASTHQEKGDTPTGSVIAYEIPADKSAIRTTPNWERRLLATDFPVQPGYKEAAPGGVIAFYPTREEKGKPVIAVSGDGSQKAYLMVPKSQDPSDWEYDLIEIHDCKATVGGMFVDDIDNDGFKEIFIPCFNTDYVVGYKYVPAN